MALKHIDAQQAVESSSFQKMAIGFWKSPNNPAIYARVPIEIGSVKERARQLQKDLGYSVSWLDVVAEAIAKALAEFPDHNVALIRRKPRRRQGVKLFFTDVLHTHVQDLSGVSISDAETKSAIEIAAERRSYQERLRKGNDKRISLAQRAVQWVPYGLLRLTFNVLTCLQYSFNINLKALGLPEDPFGSVVISYHGAYGFEEAYIPLVPYSRTPYSIGIGRPVKRPVVQKDEVSIQEQIIITLTADHRVIDAAHAGPIIKAFKKRLKGTS